MTPAKRQRLLVILACSALAILLLDWIVVEPLITHWKLRSAEITVLEKQLTDGTALLARGNTLSSRWTQMQNAGLPKDTAQAEQALISSFDRWGKSAGIELGSIKPQWRKGGTANRYSLLECKIDATGTMSTIARFIYEVEHSTIAVRVENVEISTRDESGTKLALNLTVTGLRMTPLEGTP